MGSVGWKEATIAGTELTDLSIHFRARSALQHVARLFDPGMCMRQRTFATLDHT
jgi:hypothetical protein